MSTAKTTTPAIAGHRRRGVLPFGFDGGNVFMTCDTLTKLGHVRCNPSRGCRRE